MAKFKITSIIPATFYEVFIIEANSEAEAFEMMEKGKYDEVETFTTYFRKDIEHVCKEVK